MPWGFWGGPSGTWCSAASSIWECISAIPSSSNCVPRRSKPMPWGSWGGPFGAWCSAASSFWECISAMLTTSPETPSGPGPSLLSKLSCFKASIWSLSNLSYCAWSYPSCISVFAMGPSLLSKLSCFNFWSLFMSNLSLPSAMINLLH